MGRHRRSVVVALAAMLLAVVALRFAEPIEDGDLFWHMAYGQQMLARGQYSEIPRQRAPIRLGEVQFRHAVEFVRLISGG